MDHSVRLGVRVYSQSARKKALEMLALTGDFEKSARMSGISGRTLRRWAANAAGPQQRTCGAKFEPYGDEVRGKAMEMARGGASCREIAEALGIGSPDVVRYWLKGGGVSVNVVFTIFANAFSPIAPSHMRRFRQRGCAAFGA